MADFKQFVGSRIKDARTARKMSREDLAAACTGLTFRTVGMYERGNRAPDLQTLEQLCRALDVSADYLLGLENLPIEPAISAALDSERLHLASQISGAVLEIAQLDQYAAHERDSLTPCGMILESLRVLIADTDADYKETLQQIPEPVAADPSAILSDLQAQQQKERDIIQAFEDRTLYKADQTARGIYGLVVGMIYKRLIGKPYDKTPVELPAKTYTITAEDVKNAKIKDRDGNTIKARRSSNK